MKALSVPLVVFLFLVGLLSGSDVLWARTKVYQASDYGISPNGRADVGVPLRELIGKIKAEQTPGDSSVLILERGEYLIDYRLAPRRELYISNHDQIGERPVGLVLEGLERFVVEGRGARILCTGSMLPVALLESKGVEIRNLSIDYRDPQIGQFRVLENRGEEGIVFSPAEWMQWRLDRDGTFVHEGEGFSYVPFAGIAFEPDTKRMLYRSSDLGFSTKGSTSLEGGGIHAPKWVNPQLVRGTIVATRTYYRPHPAIFVRKSQQIRLDEVQIHYAEGMGLLAQGSEDIFLSRFSVCLKGRDDPRYFTTQADATHFSGCSGRIEVRGGLFEGMMDDAINVHGFYLKILDRIDDHTLIAKYMHDQAWGFEWGLPGDSVQFVNTKTFDALGASNQIAEIAPEDSPRVDGAKVFRIRLTRPMGKEIDPSLSISIENYTRTPEVVFAGNTIRHNRARGTLLNTPRPVLVEDNTFDHVSGSVILVSTDANMWYESGQTRDLTIRGNRFIDCLTSLYQFTEAMISIYPIIPQMALQKQPFYGGGKGSILIEGNVFHTFDTPLLFALSSSGILWRNNEVVRSQSYPPYHHNQQAFVLRGCRDVQIYQ